MDRLKAALLAALATALIFAWKAQHERLMHPEAVEVGICE